MRCIILTILSECPTPRFTPSNFFSEKVFEKVFAQENFFEADIENHFERMDRGIK